MRKFYIFSLLSLSIVIISGCTSATYTPPKENHELKDYSRVINKSFDETWQSLIEYSASVFCGIENFEKESGLMVLSFGAGNPSDFITGGHFKAKSIQESFDGEYVDFCVQGLNGTLDEKMNIVVMAISENQTKEL